MKRIKRHMLLLEVLIAMAIVALCILPLLIPHSFLLKQQQQFNKTLELDFVTDLLYIEILEKLQKNAIPWKDLISGTAFPIEETLWHKIGVSRPPASSSYKFQELAHKYQGTLADPGWSVHRFTITFVFDIGDQGKLLQFPYTFTIARHLPLSASPEAEPKENKENGKKNKQPPKEKSNEE